MFKRQPKPNAQGRDKRDIALVVVAVLAVPTVLIGQSVFANDAPLPKGPAGVSAEIAASPDAAATTAEASGAYKPPSSGISELTSAQPRMTVPRVAGRPTKIVLIGDGVSLGYDTSNLTNSFPRVLRRHLAQRHPAVIVPAGRKSGPPFARSVATIPPGGDLTIIELGTNDYSATPIDRFVREYRHLVARVYAASPRTKLVCVGLWQNPNATGGATGTGPSAYNSAIDAACTHGRFVSLSALYVSSANHGPVGRKVFDGQSSNGFFPNNNGHAAIAQAIEQVLR